MRGPQDRSLETEIYSRAAWKNGVQIFGIVVVALLNVTILIDSLQLHLQHVEMPLAREAVSYLFLLLVDLTILIPLIFEVQRAEVKADSLTLKTLFWTVSLPWVAITDFKCPRYLKFAFIRTAKCFYLLKKHDMKRFDDLAQKIALKRGSWEKA